MGNSADYFVKLLRRVYASESAFDAESSIERSIDAYSLLIGWHCPLAVCVAGLFGELAAKADQKRIPSRELESAAGSCVADLVQGVASTFRAMPTPFELPTDRTTVCDPDLCDVVAARALAMVARTPDYSIEDLNRLVGRIVAGMGNAAYAYFLSSNLGIGLPANAHDVAVLHLRRRIDSSQVEVSPSPHSYVKRIFPEPYHSTMLRLLPELKEYSSVPDADAYAASCRHALGADGKRYHLWLVDLLSSGSHPRNVPRDLRNDFWCGLAKRLAQPSFKNALADRFTPESSTRCIDAAIRLTREVGAAYIPPHLDMAHKQLTVIIYLGGSESNTLQGTSLYDTDELNHHPNLSKTMPFVPNSALVLPRTDRALHGVEPHIVPQSRATLHIYLQEQGQNSTRIFPSS